MRCCKSCGCYLPDGVSECIACGYDENRGHSIDEILTTALDDKTIDVRSPMRIIQVPYMPTKDVFGYSWRAFDGKIWREYDDVVFPPYKKTANEVMK